MKMTAASLDRLAYFRPRVQTEQNEFGVTRPMPWEADEPIRVQLADMVAEQKPHDAGMVPMVTYTIRCRYRADITPGGFIIFVDGTAAGRSLEVLGVKELGRRAWLEIRAIERAAPCAA